MSLPAHRTRTGRSSRPGGGTAGPADSGGGPPGPAGSRGSTAGLAGLRGQSSDDTPPPSTGHIPHPSPSPPPADAPGGVAGVLARSVWSFISTLQAPSPPLPLAGDYGPAPAPARVFGSSSSSGFGGIGTPSPPPSAGTQGTATLLATAGSSYPRVSGAATTTGPLAGGVTKLGSTPASAASSGPVAAELIANNDGGDSDSSAGDAYAYRDHDDDDDIRYSTAASSVTASAAAAAAAAVRSARARAQQQQQQQQQQAGGRHSLTGLPLQAPAMQLGSRGSLGSSSNGLSRGDFGRSGLYLADPNGNSELRRRSPMSSTMTASPSSSVAISPSATLATAAAAAVTPTSGETRESLLAGRSPMPPPLPPRPHHRQQQLQLQLQQQQQQQQPLYGVPGTASGASSAAVTPTASTPTVAQAALPSDNAANGIHFAPLVRTHSGTPSPTPLHSLPLHPSHLTTSSSHTQPRHSPPPVPASTPTHLRRLNSLLSVPSGSGAVVGDTRTPPLLLLQGLQGLDGPPPLSAAASASASGTGIAGPASLAVATPASSITAAAAAPVGMAVNRAGSVGSGGVVFGLPARASASSGVHPMIAGSTVRARAPATTSAFAPASSAVATVNAARPGLGRGATVGHSPVSHIHYTAQQPQTQQQQQRGYYPSSGASLGGSFAGGSLSGSIGGGGSFNSGGNNSLGGGSLGAGNSDKEGSVHRRLTTHLIRTPVTASSTLRGRGNNTTSTTAAAAAAAAAIAAAARVGGRTALPANHKVAGKLTLGLIAIIVLSLLLLCFFLISVAPVCTLLIIALVGTLISFVATEARKIGVWHRQLEYENRFWTAWNASLAASLIFAPDSPVSAPFYAYPWVGVFIVVAVAFYAHDRDRALHAHALRRPALLPRVPSVSLFPDARGQARTLLSDLKAHLEALNHRLSLSRAFKARAIAESEAAIIRIFMQATPEELNYIVTNLSLAWALHKIKDVEQRPSKPAGEPDAAGTSASQLQLQQQAADLASLAHSDVSAASAAVAAAAATAAVGSPTTKVSLGSSTASTSSSSSTTASMTAAQFASSSSGVRSRLIYLLAFTRLADLETVSRACVIDALQTMRLSSHPLAAAAVCNVILHTHGRELTVLKALLDTKGDANSLHKLLWIDVMDPSLRARVLQHIQKEGSVVLGERSAANLRNGKRVPMSLAAPEAFPEAEIRACAARGEPASMLRLPTVPANGVTVGTVAAIVLVREQARRRQAVVARGRAGAGGNAAANAIFLNTNAFSLDNVFTTHAKASAAATAAAAAAAAGVGAPYCGPWSGPPPPPEWPTYNERCRASVVGGITGAAAAAGAGAAAAVVEWARTGVPGSVVAFTSPYSDSSTAAALMYLQTLQQLCIAAWGGLQTAAAAAEASPHTPPSVAAGAAAAPVVMYGLIARIRAALRAAVNPTRTPPPPTASKPAATVTADELWRLGLALRAKVEQILAFFAVTVESPEDVPPPATVGITTILAPGSDVESEGSGRARGMRASSAASAAESGVSGSAAHGFAPGSGLSSGSSFARGSLGPRQESFSSSSSISSTSTSTGSTNYFYNTGTTSHADDNTTIMGGSGVRGYIISLHALPHARAAAMAACVHAWGQGLQPSPADAAAAEPGPLNDDLEFVFGDDEDYEGESDRTKSARVGSGSVISAARRLSASCPPARRFTVAGFDELVRLQLNPAPAAVAGEPMPSSRRPPPPVPVPAPAVPAAASIVGGPVVVGGLAASHPLPLSLPLPVSVPLSGAAAAPVPNTNPLPPSGAPSPASSAGTLPTTLVPPPVPVLAPEPVPVPVSATKIAEPEPELEAVPASVPELSNDNPAELSLDGGFSLSLTGAGASSESKPSGLILANVAPSALSSRGGSVGFSSATAKALLKEFAPPSGPPSPSSRARTRQGAVLDGDDSDASHSSSASPPILPLLFPTHAGGSAENARSAVLESSTSAASTPTITATLRPRGRVPSGGTPTPTPMPAARASSLGSRSPFIAPALPTWRGGLGVMPTIASGSPPPSPTSPALLPPPAVASAAPANPSPAPAVEAVVGGVPELDLDGHEGGAVDEGSVSELSLSTSPTAPAPAPAVEKSLVTPGSTGLPDGVIATPVTAAVIALHQAYKHSHSAAAPADTVSPGEDSSLPPLPAPSPPPAGDEDTPSSVTSSSASAHATVSPVHSLATTSTPAVVSAGSYGGGSPGSIVSPLSSTPVHFAHPHIIPPPPAPRAAVAGSLPWPRDPGPLRKVLSDVDDTLFSSGGKFPAGVDRVYGYHVLYPAVLCFLKELDLGFDPTGRWDPLVHGKGNVAFLSARPHFYKDVSEKKSYAAFAKIREDYGMHAVPTLLPGTIDSGLMMFADKYMPMGEKKKQNFIEFAELYPEFTFTFIGDNGQADVLAAFLVAPLLASRLELALIHLVQPLRLTPGFSATSPVEWARAGVRFFKTYVGAAVHACAHRLIHPRALRRAAHAAVAELVQMHAPMLIRQGLGMWVGLLGPQAQAQAHAHAQAEADAEAHAMDTSGVGASTPGFTSARVGSPPSPLGGAALPTTSSVGGSSVEGLPPVSPTVPPQLHLSPPPSAAAAAAASPATDTTAVPDAAGSPAPASSAPAPPVDGSAAGQGTGQGAAAGAEGIPSPSPPLTPRSQPTPAAAAAGAGGSPPRVPTAAEKAAAEKAEKAAAAAAAAAGKAAAGKTAAEKVSKPKPSAVADELGKYEERRIMLNADLIDAIALLSCSEAIADDVTAGIDAAAADIDPADLLPICLLPAVQFWPLGGVVAVERWGLATVAEFDSVANLYKLKVLGKPSEASLSLTAPAGTGVMFPSQGRTGVTLSAGPRAISAAKVAEIGARVCTPYGTGVVEDVRRDGFHVVKIALAETKSHMMASVKASDVVRVPFAPGDTVRTAYGRGVVLRFRPSDGVYTVQLPWGVVYTGRGGVQPRLSTDDNESTCSIM